MNRNSLTATALILVIGLCAGWRLHARAIALRESCTGLAAQVAEISGPGSEADRRGAKADPHRSQAARPDIPALATHFITSYLEYQKAARLGEVSEDIIRDSLQLQDEAANLSSTEVLDLLRQLAGSEEVPPQDMRMLLMSACTQIPISDPQSFLRQLMQDPKLRANPMIIDSLWGSINTLAQKDPNAALEAIRSMADAPELMGQAQTWLGIIAREDPAAAFSGLEEFVFSSPPANGKAWNVATVAQSVATPAAQAEVLQHARDYLATHDVPEEQRRSLLDTFINAFGRWDYSACAPVLETLSPEERQTLAKNYYPNSSNQVPGPWLTWISDQLTPEDAAKHTGEVISQWVNSDWPAASAWLQQAPQGPAREAGIQAFINSAMLPQPAAAGELALTLPAGTERDQLLGNLLQEWTNSDPAAAAEFRRKNGLPEN